jgi:hypothetical protein
MAKTTHQETDEQRLTKKIQQRMAGHENPERDSALRALRKHLKRAQRKRRRLDIRKVHAMGKKKGTEGKAEAPASA